MDPSAAAAGVDAKDGRPGRRRKHPGGHRAASDVSRAFNSASVADEGDTSQRVGPYVPLAVA